MDDFLKTKNTKEICREDILNLVDNSFKKLGYDFAEYIVLLELDAGAINDEL